MTRYVAVEGPPVQGIGLVAAGLIFEAAGARCERCGVELPADTGLCADCEAAILALADAA